MPLDRATTRLCCLEKRAGNILAGSVLARRAAKGPLQRCCNGTQERCSMRRYDARSGAASYRRELGVNASVSVVVRIATRLCEWRSDGFKSRWGHFLRWI